MLTIYVRHTALCLKGNGNKPGLLSRKFSAEKLRTYKSCTCPKWYSGTLEGKWHPRTSLKTTDWEEAEEKLAIIKGEKPKPQPIASGILTPQRVVEAWLEEAALRRDIVEQTKGQWTLMGNRLLEFCKRQKITAFADIDFLIINKWRMEWRREENNRRPDPGISIGTERLRLSILKLLWKFARRPPFNIAASPIELIQIEKQNPEDAEESVTLPLDSEGDKNYRALIAGIPLFLNGHLPDSDGRIYKRRYGLMANRPDHLVAITELMYETGLRVGDAVTFEIDSIVIDLDDGWGEYTTRQKKTRKLVTTTIPPDLIQRIQALPRISKRYVFYDGHTPLNNYYRAQIYKLLNTIGEAVGIPDMHPHRLRDSFAINRLNEGMEIQDVSKLLGHASVAMTERYYAPFVKSRKDILVAKRKAAHGTSPAPKVVPIRKRVG
jgi:integrase